MSVVDRRLFLTSAFAQVADIFVKVVDSSAAGKRVAFIPTASLTEEVTFYVDKAEQSLISLGYDVCTMELSSLSQQEIAEGLEACDVIYVSGGNTFFLSHVLSTSGAGSLLLSQIQQGKLYIGESAGSIILAPCLDYIRTMDDPDVVANLASYEGLNVVDFFPLPHFGDFPFADVTKAIYQQYHQQRQLRTLSNSQALWIQGDEVSLL